MLPVHLQPPEGGLLSVLAIGAHPDDIEIGAGGTALTLAAAQPGLAVRYVVLTGSPERQMEAREAARSFFPGAQLTVELHDLPEGLLPTLWAQVKQILSEAAGPLPPDLVITPSRHDAHQDHQTIGEIVPTVFRDQLCLSYEIPKWDGDLGRVPVSLYRPMSPRQAREKVELLHKCFPSQHARDWWDDEVFLGLARLRGVECRSPYAEAFSCTKAVLLADGPARPMAD